MRIDYSKQFKKSYKKLDLSIRIKTKERIMLFVDNPYHVLLRNHSVHPTFEMGRSINITGDYRAIYIKEDARIIFIEIGTHSELYD